MNTAPHFDEVVEVRSCLDAVVSPDFIDGNGHMNVRHYFDLAAKSTMVFCARAGLTETASGPRTVGLFTAELHLRYINELREGDPFSVHVRPVARSGKALHMVALMLDQSRRRLAFTYETVIVHVDLATRSAQAFPPDVGDRLDALLAEDRQLEWPAPLSGAMAVRSTEPAASAPAAL